VQCLSNVRQLVSAVVMYAGQHKGTMPQLNAGDSAVPASTERNWWTNMLVDAGAIGATFPTPADENAGLLGKGVMVCPSRPDPAYQAYSNAATMPESHYGLNDAPTVGGPKLFGHVSDGGADKAPFFKITKVRRSAQVIMLGDAERRQTLRGSKVMKGPFGGNKWSMTNDQGWVAAVHGAAAPDAGPGAFAAGSDQHGAATNVAGVAKSRKRHANMGFFDGHAEAVPFATLLRQENDMWGRKSW
jgi:prepilin-type processing-associated H-X9-DG protein